MNAIVISATAGEQIRVERVLDNVVVERYMTTDLKIQPKRTSRYIREILPVISQEPVRIEVSIPPVPELEPTALDKAHEQLTRTRFEILADAVDSHIASCDLCMEKDNICDKAVALMSLIPQASAEDELYGNTNG